ncbi:MAG: murein biosynthesis integral membrane protein MurJ [Chlamydiales bacterium]|nr:murein biosynthesis integral membrane protein MurJ [Chlamydiales bacterium]
MKEDSSESVLRAVKYFFSGTMLSRCSGMGRDMMMAFVFGSHPALAAFLMSFRFSNLLRRVLGEGAMQSAFVPEFESLRAESTKRAATFFRDLSASLTALLFLITLVVESILWLTLEYGDLKQDNAEILKFTALMFPGIVFICLYGLNTSLLQCENRFFLPSVAPVAFNVIWMGSAFLLKDQDYIVAMSTLSLCLVIAYFFQWALTLPYSWKFIREALGKQIFTSIKLLSVDVRRLLGPLLLGVIGVSATQVNSSLDPIFARSADLEGPAYLWYAIRIQQLPLALLGVAFSGALLPSLSRALKALDKEKYNMLLLLGLKRIVSLMVPITFAFLVLGSASVTLLFGRGDFSDKAIQETTYCLWGYCIGLVPMTIVLLFATAFFAQSNFKKSAKASFFSMVINASLNALFIFGFGFSSVSVAVATSLAAYFNCFFMSSVIEKGNGWLTELGRCIGKVGIASMIASIVTLFVGILLKDRTLSIIISSITPNFERHFSWQLASLVIQGVSFFVVFVIISFFISAEDIVAMLTLRKKKELV